MEDTRRIIHNHLGMDEIICISLMNASHLWNTNISSTHDGGKFHSYPSLVMVCLIIFEIFNEEAIYIMEDDHAYLRYEN